MTPPPAPCPQYPNTTKNSGCDLGIGGGHLDPPPCAVERQEDLPIMVFWRRALGAGRGQRLAITVLFPSSPLAHSWVLPSTGSLLWFLFFLRGSHLLNPGRD